MCVCVCASSYNYTNFRRVTLCFTYAVDDNDPQTGEVEDWVWYLFFPTKDQMASVDSGGCKLALRACGFNHVNGFAWLSRISTFS